MFSLIPFIGSLEMFFLIPWDFLAALCTDVLSGHLAVRFFLLHGAWARSIMDAHSTHWLATHSCKREELATLNSVALGPPLGSNIFYF
ncbi:hypothetical protein BX661DRAFT_179264 [Kickxella alabastrina]|uniref:uncharacterized protein n=1 Tax=Kickxella alabastrina TaxID=61397 RepID=UPI002220F3DA|nr:uncharacterized protein BX661DRAFT_179264 [Kickxella alabastrina]KAI7833153.1 hypothetical protein BX661DRAFT_179264 [Kickxella alabastrina]